MKMLASLKARITKIGCLKHIKLITALVLLAVYPIARAWALWRWWNTFTIPFHEDEGWVRLALGTNLIFSVPMLILWGIFCITLVINLAKKQPADDQIFEGGQVIISGRLMRLFFMMEVVERIDKARYNLQNYCRILFVGSGFLSTIFCLIFADFSLGVLILMIADWFYLSLPMALIRSATSDKSVAAIRREIWRRTFEDNDDGDDNWFYGNGIG